MRLAADQGREILNIAGAAVAFVLVCILAFVTWALVFHQIPEANENNFTLLIGILSANVGMVVGYFYGSSVANKRQAETIDTLARTAHTAGVTLASQHGGGTTLAPGEQAVVKATDDGATIDKRETAP